MSSKRKPKERALKLCPTPPRKISKEEFAPYMEEGSLEVVWAPYHRVNDHWAESDFWWVRLPTGEIVEIEPPIGCLCKLDFGGIQNDLYRKAREIGPYWEKLNLAWQLERKRGGA